MANESLVPLGKMQIINVRKSLAAGIEDSFVFKVPTAAMAELRELTYFLDPDSDKINVKSFQLFRWRASERVNLLKDGDPNIKEIAGDGKMVRLMPVIEIVQDNEDIIVDIINNDSHSVNISLTLYFKIGDADRSIAGQGPAQTK